MVVRVAGCVVVGLYATAAAHRRPFTTTTKQVLSHDATRSVSIFVELRDWKRHYSGIRTWVRCQHGTAHSMLTATYCWHSTACVGRVWEGMRVFIQHWYTTRTIAARMGPRIGEKSAVCELTLGPRMIANISCYCTCSII